jgi:hypothetical protein
LSVTTESIIYIRKYRNPSTILLDQLSDTNNRKRLQYRRRDIDSNFFQSVLNTIEKSKYINTVLQLLTIVQEAIRILEIEYQSRFLQTKLDTIIDYFSNNTKASIFIAINSTSRDY